MNDESRAQGAAPESPGEVQTFAHQRKSFWVKGLVGALVRRLSLHSGYGAGPNSV